jgi:hypothetical protein
MNFNGEHEENINRLKNFKEKLRKEQKEKRKEEKRKKMILYALRNEVERGSLSMDQFLRYRNENNM